MMPVSRSFTWAVLVVAALHVHLPAARPAERSVATERVFFSSSGRAIDRWSVQLERLTPLAPRGYFELAEDIADADQTADGQSLAKMLFALAGRLDPAMFARSACLAIEELERDERERARLLAMAALLDDPPLALSRRGRFVRESSVDALRATFEATGHLRQGRFAEAARSAETPGAIEALRDIGSQLTGGATRMMQLLRSTAERSGSPYAPPDMLRMLVIEAVVLAERGPRGFGLSVVASGDAPMLELDPERLGDILRADATRPWFRNGAWHAEPPQR